MGTGRVTLSADEPSAASNASIIGLFAFVVVAWSLNWVVMKMALQDVTPLWAELSRSSPARSDGLAAPASGQAYCARPRPSDQFSRAPSIFVQISAMNTRTVDQKKELYRRIVELLGDAPGIRASSDRRCECSWH
jgi:hypothetical protein